KGREALNFVPGVVVTANVELNPEIEHDETKTDFDPKAVPYSHKETTRTSKSQPVSPAGRPGVAGQNGIPSSNTPLAIAPAAGSANETEETDSNENNAIGSSTKHTRRNGLTPEKVTMSIGVP